MEDGIYNAKIEGARLWFEDHGCLCFDLHLVHEGGHQSFGGYSLISQAQREFKRDGGDYTGWYIKRVFDVAEVDDFDDLQGKTIRVKIEDGLIRAIGNIIKDDWFEPRVDFKKS